MNGEPAHSIALSSQLRVLRPFTLIPRLVMPPQDLLMPRKLPKSYLVKLTLLSVEASARHFRTSIAFCFFCPPAFFPVVLEHACVVVPLFYVCAHQETTIHSHSSYSPR